MAPLDRVDHDGLEQQLKDIIQDLYQVMVQVSTYDSMGRSSKEVLTNEIKTLSRSLQTLHTSASPPAVLPSVPPELLEYVENGRNPDIYTREFVELVRRGNQLMRGKMHAFASFRDVLAQQMHTAMPELRDDVARIVDATGGKQPSVGAGAGPDINGASGPREGGDLAVDGPASSAASQGDAGGAAQGSTTAT